MGLKKKCAVVASHNSAKTHTTAHLAFSNSHSATPHTKSALDDSRHGHTERGSERKCAESRKHHRPLGNPSAAGCRQRRATAALRGCAGMPLPHPSGHHGSPTASSAPLPSAASARQRVAGGRPPAASSSSPQVRSIQAYPTLKSWVRHWVGSVFCLHICYSLSCVRVRLLHFSFSFFSPTKPVELPPRTTSHVTPIFLLRQIFRRGPDL